MNELRKKIDDFNRLQCFIPTFFVLMFVMAASDKSSHVPNLRENSLFWLIVVGGIVTVLAILQFAKARYEKQLQSLQEKWDEDLKRELENLKNRQTSNEQMKT